MTDRRSYVLVALAVFAVGLATRAVPLYWSPLPATLDGVRYASLAADAIAGGYLPFSRLDADEIVFTAALSAASLVTGRAPLRIAQPLVTVTGAASGLIAVALVRRAGSGRWRGLSSHRLRVGAAVAGLALAVDGLYLRRTGVPDEEAVGLLLVPLLALAVYRLVRSRRPGWGVVTLVLVLVLPPLHNLSGAIGALTITALVAAEQLRSRTRRPVVLGVGGAVVLGFWAYFFGFFEAAGRLGLTITYGDLLGKYPGLFLAWVVVLVVGVGWFQRTRPAMQRVAFAVPIAVSFAIVSANAVTPVFPGTISTSPAVLALVFGFAVPAAVATAGAPMLSSDRRTGPLLLSLLAGPVILICYLLTGSLTPAFFGAVMRVQTFGHLPVFVLAGLVACRVFPSAQLGTNSDRGDRGSSVRSAAVAGTIGLLLASTALTAPLAFVDLDTVSYPSTVTTGEFRAAAFASTRVEGRYATDRNQARIAGNYFERAGKPVVGPTQTWLSAGERPACPVLSRRGWTRTGAYFYPTGPRTLRPGRYEAFLTRRHLVYTSNGLEQFALSRPAADSRAGC